MSCNLFGSVTEIRPFVCDVCEEWVSDTFFSQDLPHFSQILRASLEYSYVLSDSNIHFRTEVRSYPKNIPTVFSKIGVSEA